MTQPLPIVDYINPLVADALRDPTSGINTTQLRAEPNAGVSGAVVMKADADAVIAHLQDNLARALEIAMRRADGTTCVHLVKQAFSLAKTTEMTADEVVQAVLGGLFPVLKGPEA